MSSTIDTGTEGTMSVSDGIEEQGSTEQSENTENELLSQLEELSGGFDIDISVNGKTAEDLLWKRTESQSGFRATIPFITSMKKVKREKPAHLNLVNGMETKAYADTWDSMWTNVFSPLAEDDFKKLTAYIDETSEIASLDITRAAREALEIMPVFEEGNVTRIGRFDHCNGQCVDATLKPYAGEPIDGIDNVLSKPATGNFMVTGEYLMIGNSGDYEANEEFGSMENTLLTVEETDMSSTMKESTV